MAYVCAVCGKKTTMGRTYRRKGRAKYLGGVGRHITSKTARAFRPNLQNVRVKTDSGEVKRMKVCTRCIKAGKIVKAVS